MAMQCNAKFAANTALKVIPARDSIAWVRCAVLEIIETPGPLLLHNVP